MVGEQPIVPLTLVRLGYAIGRVMRHSPKSRILIGKDTRLSGYMLESALESGLSASGTNVGLMGPLPSPGVAYMTKRQNADAGVVLSASHNDYSYNGIKIFASDASKIDECTELEIENQLERAMNLDCHSLGKATHVYRAYEHYGNYCKSVVPEGVSFKGVKLVVDCANGACYRIAPEVYRSLGASVILIGASPNGYNINSDCGAVRPGILRQRVLEEQADIGIAFDGDGDRLLMVDHEGNILNGDRLLYVIVKWKKQNENYTKGVVGTEMSSMSLEASLAREGIPFVRTGVGDRNVVNKMRENGWELGGEDCGHIVNLKYSATSDAIMASLLVVHCVLSEDVTLKEAASGMLKYYRMTENIPLHRLQSSGTDGHNQSKIDDVLLVAKDGMQGEGRVVARMSGTEPFLRVLVESSKQQETKKWAEFIVNRLSSSN